MFPRKRETPVFTQTFRNIYETKKKELPVVNMFGYFTLYFVLNSFNASLPVPVVFFQEACPTSISSFCQTGTFTFVACSSDCNFGKKIDTGRTSVVARCSVKLEPLVLWKLTWHDPSCVLLGGGFCTDEFTTTSSPIPMCVPAFRSLKGDILPLKRRNSHSCFIRCGRRFSWMRAGGKSGCDCIEEIIINNSTAIPPSSTITSPAMSTTVPTTTDKKSTRITTVPTTATNVYTTQPRSSSIIYTTRPRTTPRSSTRKHDTTPPRLQSCYFVPIVDEPLQDYVLCEIDCGEGSNALSFPCSCLNERNVNVIATGLQMLLSKGRYWVASVGSSAVSSVRRFRFLTPSRDAKSCPPSSSPTPMDDKFAHVNRVAVSKGFRFWIHGPSEEGAMADFRRVYFTSTDIPFSSVMAGKCVCAWGCISGEVPIMWCVRTYDVGNGNFRVHPQMCHWANERTGGEGDGPFILAETNFRNSLWTCEGSDKGVARLLFGWQKQTMYCFDVSSETTYAIAGLAQVSDADDMVEGAAFCIRRCNVRNCASLQSPTGVVLARLKAENATSDLCVATRRLLEDGSSNIFEVSYAPGDECVDGKVVPKHSHSVLHSLVERFHLPGADYLVQKPPSNKNDSIDYAPIRVYSTDIDGMALAVFHPNGSIRVPTSVPPC